MTDTVYALSTAPGQAGIAVIRVTGPQAGPVLASLAGSLPPPRLATLARLTHLGDPLDHALVLWFPGPKSFTGEDLAEFHLHGGRSVVVGVMAALAAQGLRPAEAGEFTKRAFLSGRLDLTEVEALADLVAAETSSQRRQALRQEGGALVRLCEQWRERLVRALALAEAAIDFPEEELPDHLDSDVKSIVMGIIEDLAQHLEDNRRGERLRAGLTLVILGAPNVGKSSLLNWLAKRDVAIVSEEAGTTRDVIEVHLDLAGYPLTVIDTAGLREAQGTIEAEGVRRALARAEQADLKLVMFDALAWPTQDIGSAWLIDRDSLVVVSRIDLCPEKPIHGAIALSVKTGQGTAQLLEGLEAEIRKRLVGSDQSMITRPRHRAALEECRSHLGQSLLAPSPDLAAEELRQAARALGRISGRVEVEELLDVIFREFCIGK
ncbi:MAG: tRNA uridine-5-carboxymethylaminomethyl(34) synthesis GTPase MnmE [Rhodospirillales bacterium]|nr:tRNA uridine-5-carboxymethylaminomethyl(34) synthesis GTPase MnmE [Rhodospirillales bacterium]